MFGLTLHQSITASIGIVTSFLALYTGYKQWWEGPKIALNIGDAIDLVRSVGGQVNKIHLACSFHNAANKPGSITKIILVLLDGASEHLFNWLQFYEYKGGHVASPVSKPCPIPVLGKSTAFQGIEFITDRPLRIHQGTYRFVVLAWKDREAIKSVPFFKIEYQFTLSPTQLSELDLKNRPDEFFLVPVPLAGMQPNLEDIRKHLT